MPRHQFHLDEFEDAAQKETPARGRGQADGAEEAHHVQATDEIVCAVRPFAKLLADLQAEAALVGVAVDPVFAGVGKVFLVVRRNGRAIDCADLEAARGAVQRLKGGA